jgi:hypothetical protein
MYKPLNNSRLSEGQLYLWRYEGNPHNYAGWHLTANQAGCESRVLFLDRLKEKGQGQETLSLSPLTSEVLSVPGCRRKAKQVLFMTIVFDRIGYTKDHWSLASEGEEVRLELGMGCLEQLRTGIADIKQGIGDYLIGNRGEELWFWWHPSNQ